MNRKTGLVSTILLLLAAGALYFFYAQYTAQKAAAALHTLKLSGNVDVREISLAFRQSDRIAELFVDTGDTVEAGQLLARLDTHEIDLQLAKAQAQLAAQQSSVELAHNGARAEERARLAARVQSAHAAAKNAAGVYIRHQQLYNVDGVSRQALDNAKAEAEAKSAALTEAKEALAEAENGTRIEEIARAEAQLAAAQDELTRQQYLRTQYELRAPTGGVIRNRLLEAGDMASATTPVFQLSLLDKKWIRAYIPETALAKVFEGQNARIFLDSLPDQPLIGQVGYISSTAEFTPKNVETEELRTALVYEVRIYLNDTDNVLRLGMPVTVELDV